MDSVPALQGVICRRARPDDYFALVELSKGIYEGRDIAPAMFFKHLDNPNRALAVAEYKGEMVSVFFREDNLIIIGPRRN